MSRACVPFEERDDLRRRVVGINVPTVVDDKLNRRVDGVDLAGGLDGAFLVAEGDEPVVPVVTVS